MSKTIERWNPMQELDSLQTLANRYLNPFDKSFWIFPSDFPDVPVDLIETDQSFELQAPAPGYKPEDISLDVKENLLTLRGELKQPEKEEKKGNYVYRERRFDSFYRQIYLPRPIDSSKVEAHLVDGMLKVVMPKAADHSVTKIPVKNGK
jgi:HSP20 family protein